MRLSIPLDADFVIFLYTIGKIVFTAMPRLRRNVLVSRIPAQYEIQEIDQAALTEAQRRYLAPYDEKLAAMNYFPVCTYRMTNYGHNLLRNYVNPMETSRCVILIHEIPLKIKGKRSPTNSCTMSFHTRFADDTILTTRNMRLRSLLDRPPYQVVQERPGISDPAEMKRVHDKRAARMGYAVPPPSEAASVFKDVKSEHVRFSEYQLSQETYKLNPDGKTYSFTDKAHWRGIRNHLNPFAHRFSARRFLPAALVAMALPLVGVTKLAPAAADAARNVGFPPAAAATAVTLACYLCAGAIIGYVLERQTFVWVFLLTYLSVRIFAGVPLGPVPYSAFAGSVAYSVAQAKKRRRAVLLPKEV
jgi:hypothetical protein